MGSAFHFFFINIEKKAQFSPKLNQVCQPDTGFETYILFIPAIHSNQLPATRHEKQGKKWNIHVRVQKSYRLYVVTFRGSAVTPN